MPAVETLEKLARALDVPMYRLFYEGEELLAPPERRLGEQKVWGNSGKPRRYLTQLALALQEMTPENRELILAVAHRVVRRPRHRAD